MTDRISLRGLTLEACHGVLPPERINPQPFVVDIDLELDLSWAGASDDLSDTISYADLADRAAAVIQGPSVDLIESLADRIAGECLLDPLVEAATVTVHKPQAPIGLPVTDVAVSRSVTRVARAVIGLGANLDAPATRLADAVRRLAALDGITALALSPMVVTEPVGGPEQPAYHNAVLIVNTRLTPRNLLVALRDVEAVHARTREVRWGARTLDLDLICYSDPSCGEARSNDPELTLPHPRAHERAFVLVPWQLADPYDASAAAMWTDLWASSEHTEGAAPESLTRDVATRFGVRAGPEWPTWMAATALVRTW